MRRLIPRRRPRTQRDRGLTLIELIVAIVVLAAGSLAALRAADQARLAIGGEMPRLLARIVVRNQAEQMILLGPNAAVPETVTQGGATFTLDSSRKVTEGGLLEVTLTARAESGEGAQLVVYLTEAGI